MQLQQADSIIIEQSVQQIANVASGTNALIVTTTASEQTEAGLIQQYGGNWDYIVNSDCTLTELPSSEDVSGDGVWRIDLINTCVEAGQTTITFTQIGDGVLIPVALGEDSDENVSERREAPASIGFDKGTLTDVDFPQTEQVVF